MAEDRVEAVERALTLLEAFADGAPQLSLAELAARTGFYKSTILRLASSLERFGYLARGADGAFRLGPAPARLGALYRDRADHGGLIRAALRRLRDASSFTASFYVRSGETRTCLYRENSEREIRHHLEEGVRLPLALGAAGKVLIAYTQTPETDAQRHAARKLRRDGYAFSLGERDPFIAALAVPLLDAGGAFQGALCLSGLAAQFTEGQKERCRELLRQTAAELQGLLR
ncbi:IclR family transcriptional regulator [Pelagibius sp. CAU 1746]|uniref:IclR family transcriptional regulator n=1 Tax=Pelagibius sp. CAU 1746 TaxID=3140370 RepID=UPI00325B52E0